MSGKREKRVGESTVLGAQTLPRHGTIHRSGRSEGEENKGEGDVQ